MAEDLEKLYKRFSLTDQEDEEIQVEPNMLHDAAFRNGKCLIITLLTNRHYNKEAFKQTMKKIWHPVKLIKFSDLDPTLFLVEFDDVRDKD